MVACYLIGQNFQHQLEISAICPPKSIECFFGSKPHFQYFCSLNFLFDQVSFSNAERGFDIFRISENLYRTLQRDLESSTLILIISCAWGWCCLTLCSSASLSNVIIVTLFARAYLDKNRFYLYQEKSNHQVLFSGSKRFNNCINSKIAR